MFRRRTVVKAHQYDLSVRVLIYREDGEYVAHALEMDIVAVGDTEAQAKSELQTLIENQMSFAACKEEPDMVQFRAPQEFFNRWEDAQQAQVKGLASPEKGLKIEAKAVVFTFAKEEVEKLTHHRRLPAFEPQLACA